MNLMTQHNVVVIHKDGTLSLHSMATTNVQSNELRFIPPSSSVPTSLKSTKGSTTIPIVHDTLSHGPASTASTLNLRHTLESRIKNWNAQQDELKLEMAKRLCGIGEVIRIATERKIVGEVCVHYGRPGTHFQDFRPVALGGPSNLHLDIINGRDTKIDIEDIYNGGPLFGFETLMF